MTTDVEGVGVTAATEAPINKKMIAEDEVQRMIEERSERLRATNRAKEQENERLRKQLDDLQSKLERGTATVGEMDKLQAAKDTEKQAANQGMSREEYEQMAAHVLQVKDLSDKLADAETKDPEFAKLAKSGNPLAPEELAGMAYLPNAPAVIKHLLKDQKSYLTFKRALNSDGTGVSAMLVLNNLSDQLATKSERAASNNYTPPPELPESGDSEQEFDLNKYIADKY